VSTPITDELTQVARILTEAGQSVWDERQPWPWETETSLIQQAVDEGLPASEIAVALYQRSRGLPDQPPCCEECGLPQAFPKALRIYADFSADRVMVRLYCPPCLRAARALYVLGKNGC
jgi:hypothetical protein